MPPKREGLLAQIEAGVLDDGMPLTSVLHKCIVLGAHAESEKMRDWARQELNGYTGVESLPDYRRIPTALYAQITNLAGYNGRPQRLTAAELPQQFLNKVSDWQEATMGGGIGELEALVATGEKHHQLIPPWAEVLVPVMNKLNISPNTRVDTVYWSVSNASVVGLLVRVRTALAELVAELISLTPADQEVPDKAAVEQALHFVVTGDRPTFHISPQVAGDGGTNSAVAGVSAAGTVTVAGGGGSAIGSQTASGDHSAVVGNQVVDGDGNTTAGRDATSTSTPAAAPLAKEGWWTRWRKRSLLVGLFIVGGAVTVFGVIGWKPWE